MHLGKDLFAFSCLARDVRIDDRNGVGAYTELQRGDFMVYAPAPSGL